MSNKNADQLELEVTKLQQQIESLLKQSSAAETLSVRDAVRKELSLYAKIFGVVNFVAVVGSIVYLFFFLPGMAAKQVAESNKGLTSSYQKVIENIMTKSSEKYGMLLDQAGKLSGESKSTSDKLKEISKRYGEQSNGVEQLNYEVVASRDSLNALNRELNNAKMKLDRITDRKNLELLNNLLSNLEKSGVKGAFEEIKDVEKKLNKRITQETALIEFKTARRFAYERWDMCFLLKYLGKHNYNNRIEDLLQVNMQRIQRATNPTLQNWKEDRQDWSRFPKLYFLVSPYFYEGVNPDLGNKLKVF